MTKKAGTVWAALLLGGLGAGLWLPPQQQALRAAAQKTDAERFVGVWRLTRWRGEGQDLPEAPTALSRLTITKDGKTILTRLDHDEPGKYKLGTGGQIDIKFGAGDTIPGIYKFDGKDRLTLCLAFPNGARPTAFRAEKGDYKFLIELTRARPGEEKPTAQELARYKDVVDRIREATAFAQHRNNLRQIGLAVHGYHDTHKYFPLHAIYDKDGKTPLLSWRVAILPFIEQEALYREFKLDEPWDSPHNKKLIANMPKLYEPLGAGKKGEGKTHYQVFTGPGTLFDGNKKMRFSQVIDGTANTILAIEARDPVIWTRPDDLVLPREKDKLPPLGGLFKGGISVLLCDGSVRTFRLNPDPTLLRAAVTPGGREEVDFDKLGY